MKITKAETLNVEIPFQLSGSGIGIMPTPWKSLEFTLIRLEDDRGNVGWGEGFGYFTTAATKAIIDRLLLPTLVGREIGSIPEWNLSAQRQIHMFGRLGISIFAISGVDIALWDLKAKREGLRVCDLLAKGQVRDTVGSYVSLVRYAQRDLMLAACKEARAEGFRSVKLHEIDLDLIALARDAVGDDPLCVDVNCGWSAGFIAQNRDRISSFGLDWLEEPVFPPEDFHAYAALRGNPAAVGAGENWCTFAQCKAALDAGAVDVFQPSVTKVGGISEYVAAIDHCAGLGGIRVFPHSPYFGPGFFASLQVAAARPIVSALEYNFVRPDAWMDDVSRLRTGDVFVLPDAPGLGFRPDEDVIAKYRVA